MPDFHPPEAYKKVHVTSTGCLALQPHFFFRMLKMQAIFERYLLLHPIPSPHSGLKDGSLENHSNGFKPALYLVPCSDSIPMPLFVHSAFPLVAAIIESNCL